MKDGHELSEFCPAYLRDVEIVWVDLDAEPVDQPHESLTPDELARAQRFDDEEARRRWMAGRRALRREMVARDLLPDLLPVTGPLRTAGALRVSTSRSGQHALIGFASSRIGVDVERVRPVRVRHRIAARAFGVDDSGLDDETFVQRWCELEAYVKAVGEPLASGFAAVIGEGWEVRAIEAPPGHRAAVVVER